MNGVELHLLLSSQWKTSTDERQAAAEGYINEHNFAIFMKWMFCFNLSTKCTLYPCSYQINRKTLLEYNSMPLKIRRICKLLSNKEFCMHLDKSSKT